MDIDADDFPKGDDVKIRSQATVPFDRFRALCHELDGLEMDIHHMSRKEYESEREKIVRRV